MKNLFNCYLEKICDMELNSVIIAPVFLELHMVIYP